MISCWLPGLTRHAPDWCDDDNALDRFVIFVACLVACYGLSQRLTGCQHVRWANRSVLHVLSCGEHIQANLLQPANLLPVHSSRERVVACQQNWWESLKTQNTLLSRPGNSGGDTRPLCGVIVTLVGLLGWLLDGRPPRLGAGPYGGQLLNSWVRNKRAQLMNVCAGVGLHAVEWSTAISLACNTSSYWLCTRYVPCLMLM